MIEQPTQPNKKVSVFMKNPAEKLVTLQEKGDDSVPLCLCVCVYLHYHAKLPNLMISVYQDTFLCWNQAIHHASKVSQTLVPRKAKKDIELLALERIYLQPGRI